MGDCIKQARAFVQGCHEALSQADDSCVEDMTGVLVDIQSGAKLNRARAIYRAAQDALQSLDDENSLPLRLHALHNVVSLYESGLIEMEEEETQLTQISSDEETLENREFDSADIISVDFSETARQSRAKDAMKSALPYADDTHRQAIDKLLAFSDDQTEADQTPPIDKSTVAENRPSTSNIALESFIRDIIQTGLSVARQFKLTLSLSYDMGGITLPETQAEAVRVLTENCLTKLICHLAAATDPESLTHIDISASPAAMTLRTLAPPMSDQILDGTDGFKAVSTAHDPKTGGLTLNVEFADMDGSGRAKPAPQKMPVEEGISSRLEALLDNTPSENTDPFHLGAVL